jgi:hypothetical protein
MQNLYYTNRDASVEIWMKGSEPPSSFADFRYWDNQNYFPEVITNYHVRQSFTRLSGEASGQPFEMNNPTYPPVWFVGSEDDYDSRAYGFYWNVYYSAPSKMLNKFNADGLTNGFKWFK